MKAIRAVAMACAVLASGAAAGAEYAAACGNSPAMTGMRERVDSIREQMDRIEWKAEDRAEQRALMELHVKKMREGMREIRQRDLDTECRLELMSSILEQMIRHQAAMHEREGG